VEKASACPKKSNKVLTGETFCYITWNLIRVCSGTWKNLNFLWWLVRWSHMVKPSSKIENMKWIKIDTFLMKHFMLCLMVALGDIIQNSQSFSPSSFSSC
jgi:hypothetical protein